jgi:hypothetical protein
MITCDRCFTYLVGIFSLPFLLQFFLLEDQRETWKLDKGSWYQGRKLGRVISRYKSHALLVELICLDVVIVVKAVGSRQSMSSPTY